MADFAPLIILTTLDGTPVSIHIARIVKITPAASVPEAGSAPQPEHGSLVTVAIGTGTASIEVKESLLYSGQAPQAGFLFLTDLEGRPLKVNAAYVVLARAHGASGTVLEVYSNTGTEPVYVQDSLATVSDWWAEYSPARLRA